MIHDGALLVRDGVVQQVGTSRRVENLAEARGAIEINAAGRVVMPGFVDSHTHLLCPPPCAPPEKIESAARLLRASSVKRLISVARTHLNSMARHGTTTVEVNTSGAPDLPVEIKLLRVLAGVRNDPLEVIPTLMLRLPSVEAAIPEYVERVCGALLPKVSRRRLARFAALEPGGAPDCQNVANRLLEAAAQAGLRTKLHGPDSSGTLAAALAARGRQLVTVDHLELATPDQVRAMAGFDGLATLLPATGFQQTDAAGTVRNLVDSGVSIALASNFNPQHTPTLNMQTVVALASMQWGLSPAEAISAATINAAHAAGCADRVGSLEVGKSADLLILNISDYRDLAGRFGMNLVHLTMKRGAFIYKEGDVAPFAAEELQPAW